MDEETVRERVGHAVGLLDDAKMALENALYTFVDHPGAWDRAIAMAGDLEYEASKLRSALERAAPPR